MGRRGRFGHGDTQSARACCGARQFELGEIRPNRSKQGVVRFKLTSGSGRCSAYCCNVTNWVSSRGWRSAPRDLACGQPLPRRVGRPRHIGVQYPLNARIAVARSLSALRQPRDDLSPMATPPSSLDLRSISPAMYAPRAAHIFLPIQGATRGCRAR